MSWKDSLQDASFRGVKFDVIRTHDSAKRDLSEHEYPYLDGADVEDMGRKARRITMTAVFWGDSYETQLQTFLGALDKPGSAELIHPVFGSIAKAQMESYEIPHDAESPDYCTVELAFVESTPSNPFFVKQLPAQQAEAISALTDAARSNGIAALGSALSALNAVKGKLQELNALRDVITGTVGAIRNQVQGIITSALDVINYPQAFAADIVSCLSGMADLRSFDVGVIMSDWKSLAGQLSNTVQLPAGINHGTAMAPSSSGMVAVGVAAGSAGTGGGASSGGSTGSGGGSTGSGSAAATGSALVPANAPPADVALVTAFVQLAAATQMADTASSILADEAGDATLSPADIEQIVNDTRTALQAAIDQHRQLFPIDISRPITEGLKDTAQAVQAAAIAVIDARPPLGTRTVAMPGNLHLTAFRWYGDYTRAAELARLNPSITNPNFLLPGDTLNAYAQ